MIIILSILELAHNLEFMISGKLFQLKRLKFPWQFAMDMRSYNNSILILRKAHGYYEKKTKRV